MNIEKILPMALKNRVIMKFISGKAEQLLRSKMEGATHVQLEIKQGQLEIKAAIFHEEKFWLIDKNNFLSMGGGFDIMKLISFIKIQGRPVDFSSMPDNTILIDDSGEEMIITCSLPSGEVVTSDTIPGLLKKAAGSIGQIEIEDGAQQMLEDADLQELPEEIEEEG